MKKDQHDSPASYLTLSEKLAIALCVAAILMCIATIPFIVSA